jgi:hypothetical protein
MLLRSSMDLSTVYNRNIESMHDKDMGCEQKVHEW